MPKHISFYIVFLLLIFTQAAGNLYTIRHIGINQGLSNNSVRCVYQDHNGFMWFGTYDGLNRYDGYSFKIFRNRINDTASLPHNYINTISEDLHGNLFVGTGQGLSIYNNLSAKFSTGFYIPFGGRQKERIPFNITVVKTDAKGNVYMGTTGGGLLVKKEGSDVAIQLPCAKDVQGVCRNEVQTMKIDKQQRVWLSMADAGLCLYDPAKQNMALVNDRPILARCMEADDECNLWMGTYDGLDRYNIVSHSISRFTDPQTGKPISYPVLSLAFDQQSKLWIGTEGGGLDIYDTKTGTINYLLPGDGQGDLSFDETSESFCVARSFSPQYFRW